MSNEACLNEVPEKVKLDGLGIYEVSDGGAEYWLIAVSRDLAIKQIREHLEGVSMDIEEREFSAKKLPLDKELTFCCDRMPIKHTVEEWIVIYEGHDTQPYLACSEY